MGKGDKCQGLSGLVRLGSSAVNRADLTTSFAAVGLTAS